MRFLFCCEFYHPSRGGVQEVMRQLAERLTACGHEITVATTRLTERVVRSHNGVAIEEFDISGNLVRGLSGEVARYQDFLRNFPADTILVNAAQQWTFDAAWPVLDAIRARKVLIPCGFSGLYLPEYHWYFQKMPDVMRKFDHLVFHAENYRDIDFARAHGLSHYSIIPNGASEEEFAAVPSPRFRASLGISENDFLILTVGTPVSAKGHTELAAAFALLRPKRRPASFFRRQGISLILNSDWPPSEVTGIADGARRGAPCGAGSIEGPAIEFRKKRRAVVALRSGRDLFRVARRLLRRPRGILEIVGRAVEAAAPRRRPCLAPQRTIDEWIVLAQAQGRKKVLKTSLSRENVVQAFLAADLFVFASNVEYSPLVLFEAAAAGTPFLTVPVGNSAEIARWTGGGVLCPALIDEAGFTRADARTLAKFIEMLMSDHALRRRLGEAGRSAVREKFCWRLIAKSYEAVLAAQR